VAFDDVIMAGLGSHQRHQLQRLEFVTSTSIDVRVVTSSRVTSVTSSYAVKRTVSVQQVFKSVSNEWNGHSLSHSTRKR